jgi:hypothetical protein
MALSKPLKASLINVEGGRASSANAPLGGATGTATAGSLIKLFEGSGVNQQSPYAYSDFDGKSYAQAIGPINAGGRFLSDSFQVCQSSAVTQYWYEGVAGTLPGLGDKCYDTSTVPGTVLPTGYYRRGPNFSDKKMQIGNTGEIITLVNC